MTEFPQRFAHRVDLDLFAQRVAPEEHDVYSLVFPIYVRAPAERNVFSYMPLLTERNH